MLTFQLYSRQGCHLCELLIEELLPLIRSRAEVEVLDIDTDPQWRSKYDIRVPVLEFNGQLVCQHRLDRQALEAVLAGNADDNA